MTTNTISLEFYIERFNPEELQLNSSSVPYVFSITPIKEMEIELVFDEADIKEIYISGSNANIEVIAYNKEEQVQNMLYTDTKNNKEGIREYIIRYLINDVLGTILDCCLLI